MRVLRVYHGGRDRGHRARERALTAAGVEVTLVVPESWPEAVEDGQIGSEDFPVVELPVRRPGDVNRHAYAEERESRKLIEELEPDVLDIHEEPFSLAARQWLRAAPDDLPVVMYTAQNVDKRYPPPFFGWERRAHRRVAALYPCSRQAASVARGKGFEGLIEVIPLAFDPALFSPGEQSLDADELVLAFFGRLVPEKGIRDAVRVLEAVNSVRPARLVVAGSGPEAQPARELAEALGVGDRVGLLPWRSADEAAEIYRRTHVVLVPSVATTTWTEQFGRVIVEAQASGAVVAGYASGSIPEVADGPAAVVSAGDLRALAEEIIGLLSDPVAFESHRARGLDLSAGRTWSAVAARQAEVYRRVAAGEVDRVKLPRSPKARRAAARAELGPTAETTAGVRPFALPLLRRGGAVPAALAAAIDAGAELAARPRGG